MCRPLFALFIYPLFCGLCASGALFHEIRPNFTGSNLNFVDSTGAFLSSPNDTFRAAIYNPAAQQSRFYLCVLHVLSNAVIWAANRDAPVSNSAILSFTAAGLSISSWSTPPLAAPAAVLRLHDDGNLVLLDATNRSLWESFDHPADTIVTGQRLRIGVPVQSSVSASDLRGGDYSFSVTPTNAFLRWRTQHLSYWSLSTDVRAFQDSSAAISFMELNQSGLFLYSGDAKSVVWQVASLFPAGFRVVAVRSDGRLVVRSYAGGNWNEEFAAPADKCRLPLSCGPLGLCSGSDCGCPQGFASSSAGGCAPGNGFQLAPERCVSGGTPQSDSYVGFGTGVHYFAEEYQAEVSAASTLSACQTLCSGNCSCLGFFFQNSSSSCYLLRDVLGSLFYSSTEDLDSRGFVKVIQGPNQGENLDQPSKGLPTVLLILLPCIGAGLLIILMTILFLWWRRSRSQKSPVVNLGRPNSMGSDDVDSIQIPGMPERFKFEALEAATDNFSTQIGVGGFGSVYKGTLPDKSIVAVKKIGKLGIEGKKEFMTEIAVIGSIRHVNLVRLRGFCAQGTQRLLVYEFMNRGSLDRTLFGSGPVLEWQERVDIALGTARGLAYLHAGCEHKIIHCDIKPENILLHDWQVKISDFGLSKLMNPEQSNLFTTMRGTRGYLAPEWLTNAAISDKTDVYSYGMVLFELIGGRKNCSPPGTSRSTDAGSDDGAPSAEYFPLVALQMHEQRRYRELADPRLEGRVTAEEVERLVRVALCCVHEDPGLRPSMAAVVAMLEGTAPLREPQPQSLNFLRFYGRRFSGPAGGEGEEDVRRLFQRLSQGSSTSSTSGKLTPVSHSYLSSQQISGPR